MYHGNIKTYDIVDGPGVRVSLFVSDADTIARVVFQCGDMEF